jgi:hypothetical protein
MIMNVVQQFNVNYSLDFIIASGEIPCTPMTDLQYPIGRFELPGSELRPDERTALIDTLAMAPTHLRAAVMGLSPRQLATPYRPGGWTIRQVVHHLADSHLSGFVRFKLAMTEDVPMVKPYRQAEWAELADGRSELVNESVMLLELVSVRWVVLLRSMRPSDFTRRLRHPEWETARSLDAMLALYAWHGRHHVAHITQLRDREGW